MKELSVSEKVANCVEQLKSLGWKYELEGTITMRVPDISECDFDKLCNDLSDFYPRVKYTFEVSEKLNMSLIMD